MESKVVLVVMLNGTNYETWKIQCRMILIRDGLWNIVNGQEVTTDASDADKEAKLHSKSDYALATIVLAIEPKQQFWRGEADDGKK